jgi:transcriptional regulator
MSKDNISSCFYRPSFTILDNEENEIFELISKYPLATLVIQSPFCAHLLPLIYNPKLNILQGHIARANPLWKSLSINSNEGSDCLVIFHGSNSYISPTWYPTKKENHKVVPTWNYTMVQIQGSVIAIDDKEWLREFVTKLTNKMEAQFDNPWNISDAPIDYIDNHLQGIIGIEIQINQKLGKWKCIQNRSDADRFVRSYSLAYTRLIE